MLMQSRWVVLGAWVNAAVYLVLGTYFLIDPIPALESVGVLVDASGAGPVELRAMYGGLEFAVGALMVAGILTGRARDVLWAALMLYLGLGGTRVVFMLMTGVTGMHVTLVSVEWLGIALNGAVLFLCRPPPAHS